ncbi:DUF4198 domain-containing protein [Stappia indica]|uniref:DUF4198 domain-containing protein n=1 Tax=Stappia indica TaxID=538381 RepID=UPI001CD3FDFC|nr:DUF4198 domain-containing protein [Stappia indica]MCA1298458.1 DUF4198 domain-containing protein [Stappia indica]
MRVSMAAVAALVVFGAVQVANAHGVWVAERWGELGLVYGHGASDDPYDPAKVATAKALDETGKPVPVQVVKQESHVLLAPESEAAVVLVDFDNGFYTEGSDGKWVNRPKSEVEGARQAGRYFKHTLAIRHLHGEMPKLPEQDLQIVPLGNPTELSAGKPLRLRVLYKGKPLAGARLIADYVNMSETKLDATDPSGEVEITVRNNGLNVIAVAHEVPLENDPDADRIQHFATLSFEAGHGHSH